jgi:hypothetical protein
VAKNVEVECDCYTSSNPSEPNARPSSPMPRPSKEGSHSSPHGVWPPASSFPRSNSALSRVNSLLPHLAQTPSSACQWPQNDGTPRDPEACLIEVSVVPNRRLTHVLSNSWADPHLSIYLNRHAWCRRVWPPHHALQHCPSVSSPSMLRNTPPERPSCLHSIISSILSDFGEHSEADAGGDT